MNEDLHRDAPEDVSNSGAEIIDISRLGAGLRSKMPISLGKHLTVQFGSLNLGSTVKNCKAEGNHWRIGVAFDEPLTEQQLQEISGETPVSSFARIIRSVRKTYDAIVGLISRR